MSIFIDITYYLCFGCSDEELKMLERWGEGFYWSWEVGFY
jgi:hypothetical protein